MNYADKFHDRKLKALQGRITDVYSEANNYIQKEAERYFRRYTEVYNDKLEMVKAGKMSKAELLTWSNNKILYGKRYKILSDHISSRLADVNGTVAEFINDASPNVYALSHNYEGMMLKGAFENIGFNVMDEKGVRYLMVNEPQLLPDNPKMANPNFEKTYDWNESQIRKTIASAILTGQSMQKVAKSLENVTNSNKVIAMRNARTVMNSARNGGRCAGIEQAYENGAKVLKEWVCTFINSREWHMDMDGERVPPDALFSNGLRFPCDAGGHPAEIYNCRCQLVSYYKGVEDRTPPDREEYERWLKLQSDELTYSETARKIESKNIENILASDRSGTEKAKALIRQRAGFAKYTPESMKEMLQKQGYNVRPLGDGAFKGVKFEDGGGYRVNLGKDTALFIYHPKERSHHDGAYWKISSGETRKARFNLDGTHKRDKI